MYKKVLLAVDGSEYSMRAAEEALKIASMAKECQVTIVLVAEFSKAKTEVIHAKGKDDLEISRRKKLLPITEKLEDKSIPHNVEVLRGEPGPTIVKYANAGNFDLVVIGSRGLNVLQEMVLGSVSHKVMKRADCPVMVVK